MFRKIWEEADRKDRDGRWAEEARQIDSRRGLDGDRTKPESYTRCGRERRGDKSWCVNDLQNTFRSRTQTLNHPDGKEVKVVVQQTATDVDQVRVSTQQMAADVDQVKRSSSSFFNPHYRVSPIFQGPNYAKAFTDGSPHQIPQRTITSNVLLITKKMRLGSLKIGRAHV